MLDVKRREFMTLLGGAAVASQLLSPRGANAQAMPVIGFLHPTTPDVIADRLRGFRQGLKEVGYIEGENVAIVYRFAEGSNRPSACIGGRIGSPAGRRYSRVRR